MGDTPYIIVGDQRHWRIVLLDGCNQKAYTYDPYGNGFPNKLKQAMKQATDRTGIPWTHKDMRYSLQSDGYNCGIWVLFLAHAWMAYIEDGTHNDNDTDFEQYLHRTLANVDIELETNGSARGQALRAKYLQIHNENPGTESFYGIRREWTVDGSDLELLDNQPASPTKPKTTAKQPPIDLTNNQTGHQEGKSTDNTTNELQTTNHTAPTQRPHTKANPPSPTKRKQPKRNKPCKTTKPQPIQTTEVRKRKPKQQQTPLKPTEQKTPKENPKKYKTSQQPTLLQTIHTWIQNKTKNTTPQEATHNTQTLPTQKEEATDSNNITTLTWNCNTLNSEALHTIDKLTQEHSPDIIILTETKIRKKSKQYIDSRLRENYRTFASHLDKQAGVILGIHNKYDGQGTYATQHTLPTYTKGYLTHVTINTSETHTLQIVAVYMPHNTAEETNTVCLRSQIYNVLQQILDKAKELNQPVIMVGDWNAVTKPNQRHTGLMTPLDMQMLRFASKNNLIETATDQHTRTMFKYNNGKLTKESAKLDTALLMSKTETTKKLNMVTLAMEGTSDHNPVLITTNRHDTPLTIPPPVTTKHTLPKEELKRPWSKEQQEAYKLAVLEQTQRETQYLQDVLELNLDITTQQQAVEDLLKASNLAAKNTLPTTTRLGRRYRPRKTSTKITKLWNKKSALRLAIHWLQDHQTSGHKDPIIPQQHQWSTTSQKAQKILNQALQRQVTLELPLLHQKLEEKLNETETAIKEACRAEYKANMEQRRNTQGKN